MDVGKEDNEDLSIKAIESKICQGQPLSEDEVYYYIRNGVEFDVEYKELNRWSVDTYIYYCINGRYFRLVYAKAATEEQESEYWGQYAVEVDKVPGLVWKEVEHD